MYNNSLDLCNVKLNTQTHTRTHTHTHTHTHNYTRDETKPLGFLQVGYHFYLPINSVRASKGKDLSFGYGSTENGPTKSRPEPSGRRP